MPKMRLTPKGIDALTTKTLARLANRKREKKGRPPRSVQDQEDAWDTLTPGLCLRVSGKTGRKTWLVRYRSNGKHRRMKLGTYPGLSLADAREAARDQQRTVDAGGDPLKERRERQEAEKGHTFAELADEVLAARTRKTRDGTPARESTVRERRRIVDRELVPPWGDRPVAGIGRREVVELVEAIAERGSPVAANRTLALVRLIFNDGLRRGFPTLESNPAHMVEPPGVEGKRDRYLTADEIRAVWNATEDQPALTRGAFRLALLTGARMGSVLAMSRMRIKGDLWTIPPEHFKGKRTQLVPLSAEALEVLAAIPEIEGVKGGWVFPSRAKSKRPHLTNVAAALARIRKASKIDGKPIPHYIAHDFRTTFRTHATRAAEDGGFGVAPNVADAVLGHAEPSLGWSRYTGDRERYLLHEKREALRKWGEFVSAAVGGRAHP